MPGLKFWFELGQEPEAVLIRLRRPDSETIPGFTLTILAVSQILLDSFAHAPLLAAVDGLVVCAAGSRGQPARAWIPDSSCCRSAEFHHRPPHTRVTARIAVLIRPDGYAVWEIRPQQGLAKGALLKTTIGEVPLTAVYSRKTTTRRTKRSKSLTRLLAQS
jgi:hypothetical protein